MPFPFVEETEQPFESLVCDVNVSIIAFDLVFVKHPAVKIGYSAINLLELCVMTGSVQAVVKKIL